MCSFWEKKGAAQWKMLTWPVSIEAAETHQCSSLIEAWGPLALNGSRRVGHTLVNLTTGTKRDRGANECLAVRTLRPMWIGICIQKKVRKWYVRQLREGLDVCLGGWSTQQFNVQFFFRNTKYDFSKALFELCLQVSMMTCSITKGKGTSQI